jgi:hypothetical protein
MIVYGIKMESRYLITPSKRGIKNYWFTHDILNANKWKYKASIEKNAEKLRKRIKNRKIKVIAIEIKEVEPIKNNIKPSKIETTLVL